MAEITRAPVARGQLAVHRLREGYKGERTALINRIRGLLTDFGLVFAQGPAALRLVLTSVIEGASNALPGVARLALQRAHLHWIDIELQIAWCDERISAHVRADARARKAASLLGIGPYSLENRPKKATLIADDATRVFCDFERGQTLCILE